MIPVSDRVLKVSGFYTSKEDVIVQFSDLPQDCLLPSKAADFAKSVTSIAESWRQGRPVHVKMRGAGEILSVTGP